MFSFKNNEISFESVYLVFINLLIYLEVNKLITDKS